MRFLMLPNDDGADDDDDDDSAMWKSQPAMERIKETTPVIIKRRGKGSVRNVEIAASDGKNKGDYQE